MQEGVQLFTRFNSFPISNCIYLLRRKSSLFPEMSFELAFSDGIMGYIGS